MPAFSYTAKCMGGLAAAEGGIGGLGTDHLNEVLALALESPLPQAQFHPPWGRCTHFFNDATKSIASPNSFASFR